MTRVRQRASVGTRTGTGTECALVPPHHGPFPPARIATSRVRAAEVTADVSYLLVLL